MLSEKQQMLLLEILNCFARTKKQDLTKNWFLKNTDLFYNTPDFYSKMHDLKEQGLMMNDGISSRAKEKLWFLTFKGEILAKTLATLPNNEKFKKHLKSEVVEVEFEFD